MIWVESASSERISDVLKIPSISDDFIDVRTKSLAILLLKNICTIAQDGLFSTNLMSKEGTKNKWIYTLCDKVLCIVNRSQTFISGNGIY